MGDPPNCTGRHAALPSGVVPGNMAANRGVLLYGGSSALTGNSAFHFCLLLQWHAIPVPSTVLFPSARQEEDSDVESAHTVSETNQSFLERSLLAAVADQNSRESGSSPPESLQNEEQLSRRANCRPTNPQLATPALFAMARDCDAIRQSCRT